MPTTTHNSNITVNVTLDPSPLQEAGFGTVLLLVDEASNSLDGDVVATFTSYEDAVTYNTGGFISASTLAAAAVVFSQRPKPAEFKVGACELSTVAAVKAELDMGEVGTGAFDTILQAHTAGEAGNAITVELVGDSGAGVSITQDGTAITIHYDPGTSTVGNVETAITALSGANDIIDVKTAGTGATVLSADDDAVSPTALAGGVDAVDSGYDDGLTACIEADPDFYGVCLASRDAADVADVAVLVEASTKKMLLAFQSGDADWLDGDVPAGLSSIDSNERAAAFYHDDSDAWAELGFIANRLVYDPDERSAPWHGFPIAGVDSYGTAPTAAERLAAIEDAHINLGLPYGGESFVADPGVNLNNRPLDEILTADWFATRLQERTAVLVVQHGARGEKIVVSKAGQKKILALIDGLLQQGVAAGHFVEGQTSAVAEAITSADLAARRMRFTVRAQLAVSARLFVFNCYFSRDPISE